MELGPPPARRPLVDLARSAAALPLLAWRALRWHASRGGWFLDHLLTHRPFDRRRLPADTPVDVLVLVADHFEPTEVHGDAAAAERVRTWCAQYEAVAGRHVDADGRHPQHTWFWRAEYPNDGCLRVLSDAAFRGFGEVEFHLHHGHDTHASFAARLAAGLDLFNRAGAMLTAEARPRRRFGYVAGNWSLDNGSGDDSKSGCNTELLALREAGCYADFTFPALGSRAQPRKTNAIYYATDDPGPKSYDSGVDLRVGGRPVGDLMIFQGPLVVDWPRGRFESAALEDFDPPAPGRLPAWLKGHVHVRGRPEWVFVKLHTHAIQSWGSFLGPGLEATFAALGREWNRPPFRLHYVTAREAYNVAKAAEAGHSGNPNDYRDFEVPRPANRRLRCTGPWRLLSWTPEAVSLEVHGEEPVTVEFAEGPLRSVRGRLRHLEVEYAGGQVTALRVDGDGDVTVEPPLPAARQGRLPLRYPVPA